MLVTFLVTAFFQIAAAMFGRCRVGWKEEWLEPRLWRKPTTYEIYAKPPKSKMSFGGQDHPSLVFRRASSLLATEPTLKHTFSGPLKTNFKPTEQQNSRDVSNQKVSFFCYQGNKKAMQKSQNMEKLPDFPGSKDSKQEHLSLLDLGQEFIYTQKRKTKLGLFTTDSPPGATKHR